MKKIGFILPILCCCFCIAQGQDETRGSLTIKQLQEDLSILESCLNNYHPDLYLYTPKEKMDTVFSAIKGRLEDGLDAMGLYRMLSPILPLVGNNHTNILPPKTYVQFLATEAKRFPFSLYYRNDTLTVSEDSSDEYIIREGAMIHEINGVGVLEVFNHLVSNMSTDGFNKTLPQVRASKGFSRHYAYHYGTPDSFDILYSDASGVLKKVAISAITVQEILENRSARKSGHEEQAEAYSFEIYQEVGVLAVRSFSPSSARKFKAFLKETFREISERKIPSIVLDVRDNLGGFPEASNELLSYLIHQAVFPTKAEYAIADKISSHASCFNKDDFFKHFERQSFIEENGKYHLKGATDLKIVPKSDAYSGDLYVLMNASSSSTAGQLLGLLKSNTNALFVGEESGGNPVSIVANDILTLILPNTQIEVRLPLVKSEMNVNFENTGRGIIPDIPISSSVMEALNGEDVVLARTIKLIKEKE